jgi:predicted RNase H-like HicB family nuclease
MRNPEKVGGFTVEAFPHVDGEQVQWMVRFIDLPHVWSAGGSLTEARRTLAIKWQRTADAFKAAGLPVPTPKRPRGNKRILDTIRRLGERKSEPIF